MDVFEALATRRSASTFDARPVSREIIERCIEAATWAPNHHRTQPWRFVVLEGDARRRFGEAIASWLARPDAPEGTTAKFIESARTKPLRSPVLIAVIQRVPAEADGTLEREDYAACACATQNLLLAAHAEGLVAKWSTGDMAATPPAREFFGLGERDHIVAYVYLGYPGASETPRRAERAPAVVEWLA